MDGTRYMDNDFERLVMLLMTDGMTMDVSQELIVLLQREEQQADEMLLSFVSRSIDPLLALEHSAWQWLVENPSQYGDLLCTLASFNQRLIYDDDCIESNTKVSLLFPNNMDIITAIFKRIDQCVDENDPLITMINRWIINISLLVIEYPASSHVPIIAQMNEHIAKEFILTEQFRIYLNHFQSVHGTEWVSTEKQLFYLKTCVLSINAYIYTNPANWSTIMVEILQRYAELFVDIIQQQITTIDLWNSHTVGCITSLIHCISVCIGWNEKDDQLMMIIFPTDDTIGGFVQALLQILTHSSFYESIIPGRLNPINTLFDVTLFCMLNLARRQRTHWSFRSITDFSSTLISIGKTSKFYRVSYFVISILGEVLSEEDLKQLSFDDEHSVFYYNMLERARKASSQRYQRISVELLLRSYLTLSKADYIPQATADRKKLPVLIEMSDQYSIIYDIIWALSFNTDIQQQLLAMSEFISKITILAKESDEEQIRKATHGILWNLDSQHNRPTQDLNDHTTFDIMISYSHKDKVLCKQLYEQLIKAGYRVWIDFEQMHGNVMDAMAQAIERSQTIIICMSEQYRRSNYCRAEAQYAFQRQLKMVPVLLQKHYKPDGWLLFLVGQLLYVDFTKHEFDRAMEMVTKELKTHFHQESPQNPMVEVTPPVPVHKTVAHPTASTEGHSMIQWSEIEVEEWLVKHGLQKMSRLLKGCDGRSLMYLKHYIKPGQPRSILNSLEEEALEKTKQRLSIIELARFQSLMDQQRETIRSSATGQ